ncbi:helix-turn-helix domain-containing protein [Dokdonella sp.]|uniref:helix-turn-helix domain-containing protein n=1 Tax=Dokdonella sp. TaxID=2291710 RepID=UPI002D7F900E|nr:helix-turn-helix domain-containing protein [Dokdonella sp.]
MTIVATPEARAVDLGGALRARRKSLGISMIAAAEAAGISRVTWHRLEKGEITVAWGSMLAAAAVLGMALSFENDTVAESLSETPPNLQDWLPLHIRLKDYPGLRSLSWQVREGLDALGPREAWEIYERNWRHLDSAEISPSEQALIQGLRRTFDRTFNDV